MSLRVIMSVSPWLFGLCAVVTVVVIQEGRLTRMNIDAGRVLFLSLEFEFGCELLSRCALDPRELLCLYPELQVPPYPATALHTLFPRPAPRVNGLPACLPAYPPIHPPTLLPTYPPVHPPTLLPTYPPTLHSSSSLHSLPVASVRSYYSLLLLVLHASMRSCPALPCLALPCFVYCCRLQTSRSAPRTSPASSHRAL